MVKNGYLEVYDLKLTTASPVFIGDGNTIIKKSYIYNERTNKVSIFDNKKFFKLLVDHRLADKYEAFAMSRQDNLYEFLKEDCHLKDDKWKEAVRNTFDAGDALKKERNEHNQRFSDKEASLKDIHTFMRNAYGQAYVPGSSVKGALRTVLLSSMMEANHTYLPKGKIPENEYLNKLRLDIKKPDNMVNSIMRGIQISDSLPVSDDNMCLAAKKDIFKDGSVNTIPLCRECIKPGTEIHMKLTLDQSILMGAYTVDTIMYDIYTFIYHYYVAHRKKFKPARNEANILYDDSIFLGGGPGFFSKSLLYFYLEEDIALETTANILKKHHHENDIKNGISPRTLKYTKYHGHLYPIGLCKVDIS